jgi:hypothetical protein
MRKPWLSTALLAGLALAVTPAFAQTPAPATKGSQVVPPGLGAEVVPDVAPGDEIAIACAPIEHRDVNSDVRVVLTVSAMPDEVSPGYKKVLATDEELSKYGVRIRVPDVPDLPNHTVNLNVYVVGSANGMCDAGHVKVVRRGVPDFRHDIKQPPRVS